MLFPAGRIKFLTSGTGTQSMGSCGGGREGREKGARRGRKEEEEERALYSPPPHRCSYALPFQLTLRLCLGLSGFLCLPSYTLRPQLTTWDENVNKERPTPSLLPLFLVLKSWAVRSPVPS